MSDTTPVVMAPLYSLRDSSGVIALLQFLATTNYLLAIAQFLLEQRELFFINLDRFYIHLILIIIRDFPVTRIRWRQLHKRTIY